MATLRSLATRVVQLGRENGKNRMTAGHCYGRRRSATRRFIFRHSRSAASPAFLCLSSVRQVFFNDIWKAHLALPTSASRLAPAIFPVIVTVPML